MRQPAEWRQNDYLPYVTDIVRHMDELEVLRGALDNVSEGVVLLDRDLNAQFLNRKMRQFWGVTEEQAASRPSYASLIANSPLANKRGMTPDELKAFYAGRVERRPRRRATVTGSADHRWTPLPRTLFGTKNGGRMLTYCDVTDLVATRSRWKNWRRSIR